MSGEGISRRPFAVPLVLAAVLLAALQGPFTGLAAGETLFRHVARLSNENSTVEDRAALVVRGNAVYAIWSELPSIGFGGHLLFARSLDGGAHWSAPKEMPRPDREGDAQRHPAAFMDRTGVLHVAWIEVPSSIGRMTWSEDGGETWAIPRRFDDQVGPYTEPSFAERPGGDAFLVWFHVSTLNFKSLGQTGHDQVAPDVPMGLPFAPSAAVDGNDTLFVAWTEALLGTAYLVRIPLQTPYEPIRPSAAWNGTCCGVSAIAMTIGGDGALWALLSAEWEGDSELRILRSLDEGHNWTDEDAPVNDRTSLVVDPALGIDAAGVLYAAWSDNRGSGGRTHFASSTGRRSWRPNLEISHSSGNISDWRTTIAVAPNGAVHVSWISVLGGSRGSVHVASAPASSPDAPLPFLLAIVGVASGGAILFALFVRHRRRHRSDESETRA